jgi:hypothetical protein
MPLTGLDFLYSLLLALAVMLFALLLLATLIWFDLHWESESESELSDCTFSDLFSAGNTQSQSTQKSQLI